MILTAKHPFLTLSSEFAELCKPLEQFHINHVTYLKQFKDGARVSLSNKPQWLDDYYNLNLYLSSLFEKKPDEYLPEFGVWIGEYDLDVYRYGKDSYNTHHSITITEPVQDGCEFYLFSTPKEYVQMIHYLANNMEILYHFILYVKDRGSALFKSSSKHRLTIPKKTQGSNNHELLLTDSEFYQKMAQFKNKFFKETPVHHYIFEKDNHNGVKLTQRELLCLKYLLQNKTADETAKLMNISRRTVESYLDHVRIKLNASGKPELMAELRRNRFLGAFSSVTF